MKYRVNKVISLAVLTLAAMLAVPGICDAQTTAFTYQGGLRLNGADANGSFDFQFGLFTNSSGGNASAIITNSAVGVTNGLFTATLDFGNAFNGNSFWLSIGVRANGSSGPFTSLSPRQAITASPYALYAPNSGTVTGVLSVSNLPPSVALLNSSPVFTGTVTAGGFTGNGNGLTNISAASDLISDQRILQVGTFPASVQAREFRTPPMGYITWFNYLNFLNEYIFTNRITALYQNGLVAAGYNTFLVDDGWQGYHDNNGCITASMTNGSCI